MEIYGDMTMQELKKGTGIGQFICWMSGYENVSQTYLDGESCSAIKKMNQAKHGLLIYFSDSQVKLI